MPGVERWCRVTVRGPDATPIMTIVAQGAGPPHLTVVDVLARVALEARRRGGSVVLDELSAELAELLDLVGLRGEAGRPVEGWDDAFDVEEAAP